ncbi:diguanylate cyclase [Krasilnikovia sp. MM14-A1004]|uniref:diguanylate cyclase n=1 Tax=Krasilnikovia sp. MM14-A1004 TaxID=3373541 RepID=UPI00399C69E2
MIPHPDRFRDDVPGVMADLPGRDATFREATTDLVPLSPTGPFFAFVEHVRDLVDHDRLHEALAAIDEFAWIAGALGDRPTLHLLIQRRMYTYLELQQYDAALAVGAQLIGHHRAAGNVPGEARTSADLAELCLLAGRVAEGMGHLARAGLLLESTTRHNDGYYGALCSYGDAASTAGLYEVAAACYEKFHAHRASTVRAVLEVRYGSLLVSWGLWLDQLGQGFEAGHRWRRLEEITGAWLTTLGPAAMAHDVEVIASARALALAKLGRVDEAIALAQPVVTARHTGPYHPADVWWGHLALAVALRARGDHDAARRESLAADYLVCHDIMAAEDRLLVQRELAMLNAEALGREACADLLVALQAEAQQLWRGRRQRLAMLHEARRRAELELEHARIHDALRRDPLTGLGNRRHFDELMAALHTGAIAPPLSLVLIDVDNFKTINDTHSHSAGDRVLRDIAEIIGGHCRHDIDTPIRYAGDEFTVFLAADLASAAAVAERIRHAVAAADFGDLTPGTPVSISTGVAALRAGMTGADLFHAADTNLYRAKRGGRNRVAA